MGVAVDDGAMAADSAAAASLATTVTKVTALRHRLAFRSGTDEMLKPEDDYQRFVESLKMRDVVGVFLLYHPGLFVNPMGPDPRNIRLARLRAAYKPLEGWITERGLEASIVDIQNPAANPLLGLDFDVVAVEVLVKRR
ncbi:MAG: hypothetical protein RJA10_27 [Pseudomonadota bacterium]|jgi:hypothetical protein